MQSVKEFFILVQIGCVQLKDFRFFLDIFRYVDAIYGLREFGTMVVYVDYVDNKLSFYYVDAIRDADR